MKKYSYLTLSRIAHQSHEPQADHRRNCDNVIDIDKRINLCYFEFLMYRDKFEPCNR